MKKPAGFEDSLSKYQPILFDSWCGEPVSWGFKITKHLGDEKFSELGKHGKTECLAYSPYENSSWGLITKELTREEAIEKYGDMTDEELGPRGGFRSVTFGEKKFLSKLLRS